MGKTYRRAKDVHGEDEERHYERRVPQPELITPEWAMKRTKPYIEHALRELLEQEMIKPYEVEDYFWIVTERVVEAIDKYDPERRNEDGRTASALNYLITTVDNSVANIVERVNRLIRDGEEVPICCLPPKEARDLGYISEGDVRFSDGCRTQRALELRMDANTLTGMLTAEEQLVLRLRFAGDSVCELSRRLGIPRMTIVRRILPGIRRKARFCGFHPPGEAGKGA